MYDLLLLALHFLGTLGRADPHRLLLRVDLSDSNNIPVNVLSECVLNQLHMEKENSHVNHLNNPSVIPSSSKGKEKISCSIGKENWFNQSANSNVNHLTNLRIAPSSTKGKQKIGSSTGKENWFTQSVDPSDRNNIPVNVLSECALNQLHMDKENSHVNHLNNLSVIPSSTKGKEKIGCSIGKENWFNQPANSNVNHLNNSRKSPSSTKGKQKIGSSTGKENWVTQSAPASNFSSSKITQSARREQNRNDSSTCSRHKMAQRARRERERYENYTQPLPKDFPVLTPPREKVCHTATNCRTNGKENMSTSLVYIEGYLV